MCRNMDAMLMLQHIDDVKYTVKTCGKDKKDIKQSVKEHCKENTDHTCQFKCAAWEQEQGINNLSLSRKMKSPRLIV